MESRQLSVSDPEQRKRFIEKARELECDEDEGRFNENLRRIVTPRRECDTSE